MKFGIFHNDKSLAFSSFTDETTMKEVAKVWNRAYAKSVDSLNYHVGVMVDGEEINEEYFVSICNVTSRNTIEVDRMFIETM